MKESLLVLLLAAASVCNGLLFIPSSYATFKLYTRKNSDLTTGTGAGQTLAADIVKLKSSNFDGSKPTKFFVHGWFNSASYSYVRSLRLAMLAKEDCNFIEVDWVKGSMNPNYFIAASQAQTVGKEIADLILWLQKMAGLNVKDVHVIGHSLGGQAVGAVGRYIQNPRVGRITGLDPAEYAFDTNKANDTLDKTDAEFVDVIHTTLVSKTPLGHVDFYPNDGSIGNTPLTWLHDHMTAVYMFTASISERCTFTSYKCSSYRQFSDGSCPTDCKDSSTCNRMGYFASPSGALGNVYLKVIDVEPYCI